MVKALTLGPTREPIETLVLTRRRRGGVTRWTVAGCLHPASIPACRMCTSAPSRVLEPERTQVTQTVGGDAAALGAERARALLQRARDGMLMAVPINTARPIAPFAPGPPTRVLERAYPSAVWAWSRPSGLVQDVASGWLRFLILKKGGRNTGRILRNPDRGRRQELGGGTEAAAACAPVNVGAGGRCPFAQDSFTPQRRDRELDTVRPLA